MTPTPPTEAKGSVSESSPEYTSKSSGASAITRAAEATSPVASLTATMLGTSRASCTVRSGPIRRPARTGMSYSTTGSVLAAATARKWADRPATEGRL